MNAIYLMPTLHRVAQLLALLRRWTRVYIYETHEHSHHILVSTQILRWEPVASKLQPRKMGTLVVIAGSYLAHLSNRFCSRKATH